MADEYRGFDGYFLEMSKYKIHRKLGEGRMGSVHLCSLESEPDKLYAVRYVRVNAGKLLAFWREIDIFMKLKRHPAVCNFISYSVGPEAVVVEYLPKGTLTRLFNLAASGSPDPAWTHTLQAITIFGFAAAMMHLHSYNAMHRFLTPNNIMFTENWEPRLVDFGFAKVLSGPQGGVGSNTLHPGDRSVEYAAPELFEESGDYDCKVDVFSYGMILYRIVCNGAPIFPPKMPASKIIDEVKAGKRPAIPADVPDIFRNVITRCWDTNPSLRPDFADIVKLFLDYEAPLFPDVDQAQYREYREHVYQSTHLTEEYKEVFAYRAIRGDDVAVFNSAKALADAGDPEQMFAVGRSFERGVGVARNQEQAFRYYLEAANRGHATAKFYVGMCYRDGTGVESNTLEAIRWFRDAAKGPHLAAASVQLALMLKAGVPEVQLSEVIPLLRKAASPLVRSEEAQYHLASILQDQAEAARYYELAFKGGVQGAGVDLASMYLNGTGVARDVGKGMTILAQLAAQNWAMAHHNLGCLFETPKWGKLDLERAKYHFRQAKELGLDFGYAKLGSLLIKESRDPKTDPTKVIELEREGADLMKQAADMGYSLAQTTYAKMLLDGTGVAPNVRLAKEYLLLAAEGGSAISMLMLADVLYNGTGRSKKNIPAAKKLYEMAAAKGNATARERLRTLPP